MFDADGHDVNCAYAGDPRLKCDCGGAKKAKPIVPVNVMPHNDNSGLAALAGDIPRMDMIEAKAKTLSQQVLVNKGHIIRAAGEAVIEGFIYDPSKISAVRSPDGRERYSYAGREFVEIQPLEFESTRDGNEYKITAHQRWVTIEDRTG